MRFLPTADQQAIDQTVREALDKHCSADALRSDDAEQFRVWSTLAELGVFALVIREELGGLGLDQRDALGVFVELGRAAAPGPLAETFAASWALGFLPVSEAFDGLLSNIAAGELKVTVALDEGAPVASADQADLLLLVHGDELHLVDAADVTLIPQPAADAHRRLFSIECTFSAKTRLAAGPQAEQAIEVARNHLLLAVSGQLLGLSMRMMDLTIEHVRVREQFGRPLGTLQAVQHRLADVAVGIEFAQPVAARAACSLAAGAPSAWRDIAMAKIFSSESAERAAYSGLQLHGAIGYTREHDFHLYAMRAWALALAYGDARRHRTRIAEDLMRNGTAERFPAL